MSVAALGWAFRQILPPKPKIVLLALADQTDERTGHVCYGKTDMDHLAQKCALHKRSLYRFIAALMRNGYLLREGGGHGRAPEYWLCLDRDPAEWVERGQPADPENDDDPQDVDVIKPAAAPQHHADLVTPVSHPGDNKVAEQDSTESHRVPKRAGEEETQAGFSRQAQALEIENTRIGQAANRAGLGAFVIEGTRAWKAWSDYRHSRGQPRTIPTCWGMGEHSIHRGWFFPSLFPPPSTGPPKSASDEDLDYFAEHG